MVDPIEKPVVDTDTGKPTSTDDKKIETEQVESLIKTLTEAGVTTADQLDGKLQASQQYGHMQNKLGDLRAENDKLIETIQNLSAQKQPAQQQTNFDDDNPAGQQVDLIGVVTQAVKGVLNEEKKQNAQLQARYLQTHRKILSDRNYSRVKNIWETKQKDPQFMLQVNSGAIDLMDAYRDVVDEFKDGLLKQSLDTITSLTGSGKPPATPHIEGDAKVTHNLPEDNTESQEVINKLTEKVESGKKLTEQEQLAALNATLKGA